MDPLSQRDRKLWSAWKRASELVRARVVEEIIFETGLSDSDFGVLTRVGEIGGGVLRQNQLAESMGFHRSRLSHQLTRMEERGFVTRQREGLGVEVHVTDAGRALVRRARPVHAAAVRRYLSEVLSERDRRSLESILEKLIRNAESG